MSDPRTDLEKQLPDHLGGHLGDSHVDPVVLDYLIDRYDVHTMLDIGCGLGAMIDLARERGLIAWGIDGDYTIDHDYIIYHDYTLGSYPVGTFDLIWCVEFVEHVEARYQDHWLETMDSGRVLFMTAAYPGQGGHHHVNEQPIAYWIDLLTARRWTLDQEATEWVRTNGDLLFSRTTGMVFVRG